MNVEQLINFLNNIEDKTQKVYIMDQGNLIFSKIDYAIEVKSRLSDGSSVFPVGVNLLCYM